MPEAAVLGGAIVPGWKVAGAESLSASRVGKGGIVDEQIRRPWASSQPQPLNRTRLSVQ